MITFIFIFVLVIVGIAGFLIANGANGRKRARMSGASEVAAQKEPGGGSPPVGRASGSN